MATTNVNVIIEAIDRFSGTFKSMGQGLTSLGKNADDIAAGMTKLGSGMVAIGAAPAAAIGFATKSAIEFESAFAGVRKTVDLSEAEFNQLAQNFRNISKVTPLAVNDLNRIGEIAGSLGIAGVKDITKFTETIAQIGITSNLTEEEAAMAFGQIANIMQEPIDNVDRMGALVIDLGNKFAATESDITNFAQRIAGAGKIAGLTTANIFEIGAAMASVGVEAEAGGTAVQKVLIDMKKAVVEGGKQLDIFARASGQTSAQFKANYEEDAMAAFGHFVEGLGKAGDEAINILSDLGLEDQRLIRAFLSLANAGELLNDTYTKGSKAWADNLALTQEAEKRYATTSSQMQIFANNVNDIGITLGSVLLPRLNELMERLKPIVAGFAEFAKEHPGLTVGLLSLGAAVGTLGGALIILAPIFSSLAVIIPGIVAGFTLLKVAVLATAGVLSPFILVIGGVALAIGALALAWTNNWGDIQGKTKAAIGAVVGTFNEFMRILDVLGKYFQHTWEYAEWGNDWAGHLPAVMQPAVQAIGKVVDAVRTLGKYFAFTFETKDWGNDLQQQIPQSLQKVALSIGKFIAHTLFFIDDLKTGLRLLWDLFTGGDPAIAESEYRMAGFAKALAGIRDAIFNFQDAFSQALINVQTSVSNTATAMGEFFNNIPSMIAQAFAAATATIYKFFTNDLPYAIGFAVGRTERFFTVDIPAALLAGLAAFNNFATVQVPLAWQSLVEFMTVQVPLLFTNFVMWVTTGLLNAQAAFNKFVFVDVPMAIIGLGIWLATEIPAMGARLVQWFSDMGQRSWEAIILMKNNVINTFVDAKNTAIAVTSQLVGSVIGWISSLPSSIDSWLSALPGIVANWFEDAKAKAIGIAESMYNGVKEWFGKIIGFFGDIINKAGEAIGKAGEAFNMGRQAGLSSKQTGGIVPGPIGQPVPIMAHGGERVTPVGLSGSGTGGGGGNISLDVHIGMYAGSEIEKRNIAKALYGALLQVAQSQNKSVSEFMGG